MIRQLNLRHILALTITLLAIGLTGIVTTAVGGAGIAIVEQGIGNSLLLLADQMQDKLDRSIFARLEDIRSNARLFATFDLAEKPVALNAWLGDLLGKGEDYAAIGLAGKDGRVIGATAGWREGSDVAQRSWFRDIGGAPFGAAELEESASGDGKTASVLDIAQPVIGKDGQIAGVLAAQVNWNWLDEIKNSVASALNHRQETDILVLSKTGTVLLGPPEMLGKPLQVAAGEASTMHEAMFGGRRYLFAYVKTDGYRNFAGLGWSVIVRQDAQVALAPVRKLQLDMALWGTGVALLAAIAAWMVAGRIAAPLLRLARAAQSIRRGDDMDMPELHSYAEVEVLSRSFASLVADLKQRERALSRLNETLESQVEARTSELAARGEALAEACAKAESATEAKSRFLSAAGHDLRQPLHAMMLFARALSRRVVGGEAARLVRQLEESLKSLKEMFDALLNVSKLDAGLIQPILSTISARALIERVSEGFRLEAESRGLRFVSRPLDVELRTDPALLETMLRNLVSNGLKFTREGGVALIVRRVGGSIAFQILDTGPGIPPERQQCIFREFERSTRQAQGVNDGLGLGLSIVLRYADLLGIEAKFSSRLGHGTCFSLIMPRHAVQRLPSLAATGPHRNGAQLIPQGFRVLVMDDDPVIAAALTHDLSDRGCQSVGATSLGEAEAILAQGFGADALVVDFDLGCPESGLDFLSRIRQHGERRIPGLILTGGTDAATLAAVVKSGLPWMTKPADPDMIASALAGIVARRDEEIAD